MAKLRCTENQRRARGFEIFGGESRVSKPGLNTVTPDYDSMYSGPRVPNISSLYPGNGGSDFLRNDG
jgi:hypothetical protein